MKTTITSSVIITLLLCLVLSWLATATTMGSEPQYRGPIKPIQPTNIELPDNSTKEGKVEMPKHDSERIYYGPDGRLFPTPKLPRD